VNVIISTEAKMISA